MSVPNKSVLVVGAGVGGMRAAVDLADLGAQVYLVERSPSIGGVVAQLDMMFPTHDCILCRGTANHGYGCTRPGISPWLLDGSKHPAIELMTMTDVLAVEGEAGDFAVRLRHRPRYVDPGLCINCNRCTEVCPVELPDPFQQGMSTHRAAFKVSSRAAPNAYVIERGAYCDDCGRCVPACPTAAIDLQAQEQIETVHVGSILLTVGYQVHDPSGYVEYGYGRYPNVLTSLEFERLISHVGPLGPTRGALRRPSDGQAPARIAWLQCIGSRDESHPYCSSICCMYANKQAMLARQLLPEAEARIFMMDERYHSKGYSAYAERAAQEMGVGFVRSRISVIHQDPATNDLLLRYQLPDGTLGEERFGMVVLSVGSEPPTQSRQLADMLGIELNAYGFCQTTKFAPLDTSRPGIYVAGAFATPKEIAETVVDASGAVARAATWMGGQPVQAERPLPVLEPVPGEAPRVGVFCCRCGGEIDGVIDLDTVLDGVRGRPDVAYAGAVDFGCLEKGMVEIGRTIDELRLNRVVIGACTARTHEALFQKAVQRVGLNPHLVELVSLREGCAWVHQDDPAGATRKARELVQMGVQRAARLQPLSPRQVESCPRALVLGGGVAGMTAALNLADQGYETVLVEREAALGGNMRRIRHMVTGDDPQAMLSALTAQVEGHERIAIHRQTELVRLDGAKGDFRSTLRRVDGAGDPWQVRHGALIVATGAREYRGPAYLLDQDPRVATQLDLEALLDEHPAQAAALKSVVMIQCVGPWNTDPKQAFYCSRVCCTGAIKHALQLKALNPDCQIVILYRELMTYGFNEQYYTQARERGVLFVHYEDHARPQVSLDGGRLVVRVRDHVLGQEIELAPDLLALSTCTVPAVGTASLARALDVPLSPEGFYLEDNYKLRPMDMTREGIFLCGTAHYPKASDEAIAHALAAAARAATVLAHETVEANARVAVVDQTKCVGCLTCVRTCPFHVPKIDRAAIGVGGIVGAAFIEPTICTGCGICTGECPAAAIQLSHYQDDQIVLAALA